MVTKFGKMCRKIRIDANERLADMANKLGVSSAFLSAVENGKKNVPFRFVEVIAREYDLSVKDTEDLKRAADDAVIAVKIPLVGLSQQDRKLVLSFSRKFCSLRPDEKDKILKLLKGE